jgi:hypothetical protein
MTKTSDADIATALKKVVGRTGWKGMFKTAPLVAKEMHVRSVSPFRVNKVRAQLGIKAMSAGGRRRLPAPALPSPIEEAAKPAAAANGTPAAGDDRLASALRTALETVHADVIQRFGLSKLTVCFADGEWQPAEVTRPRSDLIPV